MWTTALWKASAATPAWWRETGFQGSITVFVNGSVDVIATFVNCIILADLNSDSVGATFFFDDILGSVDPGISIPTDNLNFSLDPQFCGIEGSGNYFLQSTSPCLPENNPYGSPNMVGPLPAGCSAVRVQLRTWGGVKALYRDP